MLMERQQMDANETTDCTAGENTTVSEVGTVRKTETKPRVSRRLGKVEYENCCRIYFIEAVGMDLIKIGYTIDPAKRFLAMLTSSPAPLSLLGSISGGPQKELEIHTALDEHRLHGEWFKKVPPVMALVETADQLYGHEFYNQVARERGAALREYLAKMKRGEVVRPTRGAEKRPRSRQSRDLPYIASGGGL